MMAKLQILWVKWAILSALSTASRSQQSQPQTWQTIFPDTNLVVPLFGDEGPRWILESTDGVYREIDANVPGDVLSDLMNAGEIGDPYFSRNFLTQRHVWMGQPHENSTRPQQRTRSWKYTTQISLENSSWSATTDLTWILVLEGVKMGASVSWNGQHVGLVNDQFLRYTFELENSMIEAGGNLSNSRQLGSSRLHELSILFDPSIGTDGRYMACSGGWDWAPYSRSVDDRGSPVFSFGVSKPLYLVAVKSIYISHVVPKVYYKGPYPRRPMLDGPQGDFLVSVDVHLKKVVGMSSTAAAAAAADGLVVVLRSNFSTETNFTQVPSFEPGSSTVVTVNSVASKHDIKLWWPNGMGDQPLYHLEVSIQDTAYHFVTPWVSKRIGFRTTALVTVNDTDDSVVDDILARSKEGSGSHGMYFRINGAAIWNRGANFIPMDQLDGRLTSSAHRLVVESAAAAHMNILRIWGGGMILPNAFYDACDENGILLYHDMMFVEEQGHGALRSQTVENELRHIIRSLAAHPSIVVWNGCNECTYFEKDIEIYASYVMQNVAEEDATRSLWPTSPSSHGWKTGVSMLDGLPNGNPLKTATVEADSKPIENHGPYQHGWSKTHPSVNGQYDGRKYDTNTPPVFHESQLGVIFPNMFTSEFGASVFSSFESMSDTLEELDWGVHGGSQPDTCHLVYGNLNECNGTNVLAERNYACDSHILAYFGAAALDEVGEDAFKSQLYQCMVSQALWIKGQIEVLRASNSFGALLWQMNEIWPTGGWGLVEYDGAGEGGRWKPLMHLLQDTLYRDVFVGCGQGGRCYVRNDALYSVTTIIALEGWVQDAKRPVWMDQHTIHLQSGPGTIAWFQVPLRLWNGTDIILIRSCNSSGTQVMGDTVTFLDVPSALTRVASMEDTSISIASEKDHALVTLVSNHLSLYVTLSTRAKGRFSENSFHLRPGIPKIIEFRTLVSGTAVDMKLFKSTIRVDQLILTKHQKHEKPSIFEQLSKVVSAAMLFIQLNRR